MQVVCIILLFRSRDRHCCDRASRHSSGDSGHLGILAQQHRSACAQIQSSLHVLHHSLHALHFFLMAHNDRMMGRAVVREERKTL